MKLLFLIGNAAVGKSTVRSKENRKTGFCTGLKNLQQLQVGSKKTAHCIYALRNLRQYAIIYGDIRRFYAPDNEVINTVLRQ